MEQNKASTSYEVKVLESGKEIHAEKDNVVVITPQNVGVFLQSCPIYELIFILAQISRANDSLLQKLIDKGFTSYQISEAVKTAKLLLEEENA